MQKLKRLSKWVFLTVCLALVMMATVPDSSEAGSYTLQPLADNAVTSAHGFGSENWGDYKIFNAFATSDSYIYRSYLKFDLSDLHIPTTEVITGGDLKLWVTAISGLPLEKMVEAYTVPNNSWSESTITWNNQPGFGSLITSFSNKYYSWSHVILPAAVLSQPIFSLGLKLQNEIMPYPEASLVEWASKEYSSASYRPLLTVETSPVPLPSAIILLGAGLGRLALYSRRKLTKN